MPTSLPKSMLRVGDRVCCQGKDSIVGEVVSVTVRVKFPDGFGVVAFTPEDLRAAPAPRAVAAPSRKRKSYDVVIEYDYDHDYGSNQDEIGSLNKRFKSMDAAVTALVLFYEEHGKDVDKDVVVSELRKHGKWEDEREVKEHTDIDEQSTEL